MIRPLSLATLGRINVDGSPVLPMATIGRLYIAAAIAVISAGGGGGWSEIKQSRKQYNRPEEIFGDILTNDDEEAILLAFLAMKVLWRQ